MYSILFYGFFLIYYLFCLFVIFNIWVHWRTSFNKKINMITPLKQQVLYKVYSLAKKRCTCCSCNEWWIHYVCLWFKNLEPLQLSRERKNNLCEVGSLWAKFSYVNNTRKCRLRTANAWGGFSYTFLLQLQRS